MKPCIRFLRTEHPFPSFRLSFLFADAHRQPCRSASAARSMRISSAVDAHQQRGRCASANNIAVQKQGKRCVESMNRTAHTTFS